MAEPIVYLNGDYLPVSQAKVSVLDRGFLFADGVYESLPVYNAQPFMLTEHLTRLNRNLNELQIPLDYSQALWIDILDNLINHNGLENLILYIQITRGDGGLRQHDFPEKINPTVFICTAPLTPPDPNKLRQGYKVITLPDQRWGRCDIKSIGLLPNILALETAKAQGADDVIFVRSGFAVESVKSNIFVVRNNDITTPPLDSNILPGLTRARVIELAKSLGLTVKETPIPEAELYLANEIFLSASISELKPIIALNQRPVGTGQAGPMWERLFTQYQLGKPTHEQ